MVAGAGWPWRGWDGRLSAPLTGLGDLRGGLGHSFGNPSKECLVMAVEVAGLGKDTSVLYH